MIIPLVTAAVIATSGQAPDHLGQPVEVNYGKPHKGAFSDVITEAAEIPKKHRAFSKCVLDRESGGNLENTNSGEGARNPRSSASGRWQFLDSQWREGLSHMVAGRLKDYGMPSAHVKGVRVHLEGKPIHKWDGLWQDVGHNAVMAAGGWAHWSGPGCNGKR